MKKLILILSVLAIAFAMQGQTLSSSKMKAKYASSKKLDKATFKLSPDDITGRGTICLLTPDVTLNFTRIQKADGDWKFGGSFTPGISYNLVIGQGTKNTDGSVSVEPYFSFGGFADFGTAQSSTGLFVPVVDLGGCIGLYKYISVAGGFDVINKHPYFAIGGKISLFTFSGGSAATILSFK